MLKLKAIFVATLLGAAGIVLANPVPAVAPVKQQLAASCTTRNTEWSGVRHACDAPTQVFRAPQGFVFAERSLKATTYSGNGSEHSCTVSFDGYVEIIADSGIMQPTVVTLNAHARSRKGASAGRGWATCGYELLLSKYK